MQLRVTYGDPPGAIAQQWAAALADVIVRHPDRSVPVRATLRDGHPPELEIAIDTRCSTQPTKALPGFILSTVRLSFFPGQALARAWLAAAWAGYIQHEALELVTVGDLETRPIDPHAPPFDTDRGLRDGMPPELTPETLRRALCVAMDPAAADRMIWRPLMARSVTFLQMRTAVATRGSYENSADITATVLSDFVNEAVAETWDILVGKWEDYYVTRSTIAVTANQDGITVPADFYKLRLLQIVDSSVPSGYRRLRPHDLDSANTFFSVANKHYRYRLEGGLLYLAPIPVSAETLRLFYIPACPLLVADGDTFDGINGYEQLAVQLALLRCQKRQDQPTQETMSEVARLTARVRTAADSRDADEPFYLNPRGPVEDGNGWNDGDW